MVSAHDAQPTTVGRRPDRRPPRTIQRVLDAGLDELRQTDYADLTMRAVAARAGVSAASAYKYFPSKSALVAAIYLGLLRAVPSQIQSDDTPKTRLNAMIRDMALVAADEPELLNAFAAAVMAEDPAVGPIREEIAEEVAKRISIALGPGWSRAVKSTLLLTFSGALMAARFVPYDLVIRQLGDSVELILGAAVA